MTPSNRPVLVVDDDASIRSILEMALEGEGLTVTLASDGREALNRVEEQEPSLVLLDMAMPVLDGRSFCEEARALGFNLAIVVMTARQNASRLAVDLGAAGHLGKPFDLDELLACVHRHRRN
jgi:CheY-like chemotaxis protein